MIVLRRVRFISGGRIYRSGEAVPENAVTHELAEMGFAEIVNNPAKPSAKRAKAEPAQDTAQQNDKGDS